MAFFKTCNDWVFGLFFHAVGSLPTYLVCVFTAALRYGERDIRLLCRLALAWGLGLNRGSVDSGEVR